MTVPLSRKRLTSSIPGMLFTPNRFRVFCRLRRQVSGQRYIQACMKNACACLANMCTSKAAVQVQSSPNPTCRRLSSVEAVLWTAFFFLRTEPFPPVRTCAAASMVSTAQSARSSIPPGVHTCPLRTDHGVGCTSAHARESYSPKLATWPAFPDRPASSPANPEPHHRTAPRHASPRSVSCTSTRVCRATPCRAPHLAQPYCVRAEQRHDAEAQQESGSDDSTRQEKGAEICTCTHTEGRGGGRGHKGVDRSHARRDGECSLFPARAKKTATRPSKIPTRPYNTNC